MNLWKNSVFKILVIISVLIFLAVEDVQAKTKVRAHCPNLEQLQTEIQASKTVWTQVTDIRFKDPHATMPFMINAVRKLYQSKKWESEEKSKQIPIFKQDNCNLLTLTYPNEEPKLYEIREHSYYKVVLNFPEKNDPLTETTFRIKHYYGRKTLEHVKRITYSYERPCMKNGEQKTMKEESEIEISTLAAWYKEVPQKRVISDKLLRLLTAQIKADAEKSPDRSIASCE